MFRKLLAIFLICFATLSSGASKKTLKVDPDRTITVIGVVTDDQVGRIMALAMMALESNAPVNILIDSPGGSVGGGDLLMAAMKKLQDRGVVVRCITRNAMSMAMYMQVNCTERYALPGSKFLWHPVRASGMDALTAEEAKELAEVLKGMDDRFNGPMQEALGMDDEPYWAAWKAEKAWSADELVEAAPNFMSPIEKIEGMDFPEDSGFRIPGL